MKNLTLLGLATVAVFATVGCGHTQRLQWHLPQLEIDSGGIGFYVPFPTVKDGIEYESPFKIQPGGEPHQIYWTEPTKPEIRFNDQAAVDIMGSD